MTHFDLIDRNVAALEVVKTLRQAQLSGRSSFGEFGDDREGEGKKRGKDAERERKRRASQRELYEELGRFYELTGTALTWRCPKLLAKGKLCCDHSTPYIPLTRTSLVLEDVESLQKPPATSSA